MALDHVLSEAPPALWAGQIDQAAVPGLPTDVVIFFHLRSRTTMRADLASNYTRADAALDPGALEALGPHERHRRTRADAVGLAQKAETILQWDFERVAVSHGELANENTRALFAAGFAFLKRRPARH